MKMPKLKLLAAATLTASLSAAAPFAFSQATSATGQVDDETVSNFVDAYSEVREIHADYSQRLQESADSEQAMELQQEAQQKMEEAVQNNDISVEEYKNIAQQISSDPELRSRVQQELESSMAPASEGSN